MTFTARRATTILLVFFAGVQTAAGATRRLKLSGEMCDYAVTFDPQKVNEAQLRSTFDFLTQPWTSVFSLPVFSAKAAKSIDLATIDKACAESLKSVKSASLLPLDGLDSFRGDVIAEIEDSCRYDRLDAEGFQNPSVLRRYTPATACMSYVDALEGKSSEGKSDLGALFDKISQRQCAQNASPKSCLAEARKNRGNIEEMKVYVHNFGWNHCAIDFNLRNSAKNQEKQERLFKTFGKAFKLRETSCSEP